jgi:biotin/methionine sulfoxide reductase
MSSDQPADKLHSQLDHSPHARATKIKGRQPVTMHPDDAAARGIAGGDLLRVFNDRGACLAAARLSDRIRRGVPRLHRADLPVEIERFDGPAPAVTAHQPPTLVQSASLR